MNLQRADFPIAVLTKPPSRFRFTVALDSRPPTLSAMQAMLRTCRNYLRRTIDATAEN